MKMAKPDTERSSFGKKLIATLALTFVILFMGSDHADPIKVRFIGQPESNLTGLFAFEHEEKLVIALCARPGLAEDNINLQPFVFTIHIDCDSDVHFADNAKDDQERTFRYGGRILKPQEIKEDIEIQFRFDTFDNQNPFETVKPGSPIELTPEIVTSSDQVDSEKLKKEMKSWVGLRDDPFILQGFSATNVVAMVVEIPFTAFGKQDEFLIWGTSSKYNKLIDHVGRSLRTMLPRFDFLNGMHPSKHVDEIKRRHEAPGVMQDIMTFAASPIFGIRHYDFEPDVLIFSRNRWQRTLECITNPRPLDLNLEILAFPNGRRLTDDVAKLMCDRGDCLLFEVSTLDAHADDVHRPTTNGKPFLNELPYLASPNENPMAAEMPTLRWRTLIIIGLLGLAIVAFFLLPWVLYWKARKKLSRARDDLRNLSVAPAG